MLEAFKLSVPDVPPSYEGRLYFILGPGLGDTVNDFRILHEVLRRYPNATPIVYADPRWKSLYSLLPETSRCMWRYHVAAPSGELAGQKKEQSYSDTLRGVHQEIETEIQEVSGYVAVRAFTCLDQLAQKESVLVTNLRSIGLQLSKEQCRPYLPLTALPLGDAQEFLHRQGVQPGNYIAIAPQTWEDKAWEASCWQKLTHGLFEETRLPILMLGMEGFDALEGPGIFKALGLPLPLVAALIAKSKCFVGLDSGLTHMAACFDIPIVGLQAQGKFPPFLVEPHSPLRRIHLTPFVYGRATISPESVQVLVQEALKTPSIPLCPLCENIPYVLGAHVDQAAYLCRCGLMYRVRLCKEGRAASSKLADEESMLPLMITGLDSLKTRLQGGEPGQLSDQPRAAATFAFEHWNSRETSPDDILSDRTNRELWWSWNAVHHLVYSHGWQILESQGSPNSKKKDSWVSFVIKVKPGNAKDQDVRLQVPWGSGLVWLKRALYDRWLCWESFERANELEDLGGRLVKEGYERDGRDILRFAVKREWRGRTLGRLLRSEWKALGSGWKNSEDIPMEERRGGKNHGVFCGKVSTTPDE